MRSPVIILGMHRSGTSLFSQWLSASGLNLGERLYGASPFNPYGYYEDCDFIDIHKAALRAAGVCESGHEKPLISNGLFNTDPSPIKALVERKQQDVLWGWKEPRTCLFLPAYRQISPGARYVVVVRRYESIIASLVNRERLRQSPYLGLFRRLGAEPWLKKYYQWRYNNYYAKIVSHYFMLLLSHLEQAKDSSLVVNLDELLVRPAKIKSCLEQFLPELNFVDFGEVYDGSVMSKPEKAGFLKRDVASLLEDRYQQLLTLGAGHG